MTKFKFLDVIILSFVLCHLSFLVHAAEEPGRESEATQLLNAHGENMELEFKLYDPGTETWVDYEKYGHFVGVGTEKYEYKVTDRKGLAAAVGEAVYPNNSIYKDPTYRVLVSKGRLAGSQWDYVNIDNQQLAFYKWASSHDTMAVQQYYTALTLEKLGEYTHAIKAYHAVIVHFPKQIGWTVFRTPLYMARLALDRIDYITRKHPKLGIKLVDAEVRVQNGFNFNINDDKFFVKPGKLVKVEPKELRPKRVNLKKLKIVQTLGKGPVQAVQFENGDWQLRINGRPTMVKAVAYSPTPVGKSPHEGYNLDSWMVTDLNNNGKIDGPFDAWVDKNKNNKQDPDERAVGDFRLMKEMGVNTVRLYHHSMNKTLLRKLYKDYGIRVIMGDLLGMYAVGSKAEWFKGTDYADPVQQKNMMDSVKEMVTEYKDEPYILMWMLGNESNYGEPGDPAKDKVGFGSQARLQPEAHYKFVNDVAAMIKSIDPNHLVGFSNGEIVTIDILGKHAKDVDIFGVNSYRGASGFGPSLFQDAKEFMAKPVLITEYGCPAYYAGKSLDFAEQKQIEYHKGNWEDLVYNSAGSGGVGNAIGGVAFEFVDEWWKAGPPPKFSPKAQETRGDFQANFPDGWMYEEWLGLTSQSDGSQSPYMRQLRKVYDYYKRAWNK